MNNKQSSLNYEQNIPYYVLLYVLFQYDNENHVIPYSNFKTFIIKIFIHTL